MNEYDSARMADILAPMGYRSVDAPDTADLIVLNTCHIREKAAEKVYSELGRMRELKTARGRDGQPVLLAVAGCVAQAEGGEIMRRAPQVDLVLGPQAYHRLGEMVGALENRASRPAHLADTDFPPESKFDFLPPPRALSASAYITVQEGCDKFCSFCVVPYTRGAEWSRPVEAILAEAETLAAQGVRELTLLGQNVNAFHGAGPSGAPATLGLLLRALGEIAAIERLRYTTSHPLEMDDELIAAHRDLEKLMPFVHLPVQSGSDKILAAMNRRHRADDYLRIVDRLRAARADLALGSDFIVGFPGETDEDFQATLALTREVGFAQGYTFKYSPRPGTPAAARDDQVDEAVKSERLAELQAVLGTSQLAFNQRAVGRRFEILFERPGRRPRQWIGKSPYSQAVRVESGVEGRSQLVTWVGLPRLV